MTTRAITLTNEWQQVTERGQSGFIQIISGIAYLCESETQPDDGQAAHPRTGDVNFGDVTVWGRSSGDEVLIIVSATAKTS
ncbi:MULTISPECIES: hypothetical protein [Enterobacteriaceae]|uniref:hypothetical protein n=1 Tax=Enterobacter kobei TaxID=208224 RepID=UPI000AB9A68D|nr:hypothetical protein [Enterobacter kobei]EHH8804830.1 hypothetical protein [Escherichia coli]